MKKNTLVLFYSIISTILFSNFAWSQSVDNSNKSKIDKFEVGGQFTILRRSDADTDSEVFSRNGFGSRNYKSSKLNELGLGGRFTFNFTKNIAVESEANFFRKIENPPFVIGVGRRINEPGGRKFQAVFGPKIGIRKEKFGVFAKVRPGFISFDKYNVIKQIGPPNDFYTIGEIKKSMFFNLDVGGVFEYYPTRRTVFRVDVGDTIIYYNSQKPKNINPSFTRHNLQTNIGFGFRF